jgi:hypothetical protein
VVFVGFENLSHRVVFVGFENLSHRVVFGLLSLLLEALDRWLRLSTGG